MTPQRRKRVMIIEDSPVARAYLQHLIKRDERLEVAAAFETGEEALQQLPRVAPDVISMDIRLPGMNGFEVTRQVMREYPTPIVVVSASIESEDLRISMNALRAGALAVVEKPVGPDHRDSRVMAERLCNQLALMSEVRVVRQRLARSSTPVPRNGSKAPFGWNDSATISMVGIVASTGGPAALQTMLSTFDAHFPVPIVLVQHIAAGFVEGFANWLNSVVPLDVRLAHDGDVPSPGTVYVAPADHHLVVQQGRLRLLNEQPYRWHLPSGTLLFNSLAQSIGASAVGVLLTGMGDDGAAGLKALYDAGGYTIAEDESTAVVYGMPAVAVKLQAVRESLPLTDISSRVQQLVQAGRGHR